MSVYFSPRFCGGSRIRRAGLSTLAPGLQDPNRLAPPPPSQAKIDHRNARFDRTHGYRRRGPQRYPSREDDDWKPLNGS